MKRSFLKKHSSIGRLRSQCDTLLRKVIIAKRGYKCEWCGREDSVLHSSHILSKGAHPRLRYLEENIFLLCYRCHLHRWHKSPLEATDFLHSKRGVQIKDYLLAQEKMAEKQSAFYLNLKKTQLERELEEFKK